MFATPIFNKQTIRMKQLFFVSLLLASCGYKQICFVSPAETGIRKDSVYIFENDTLRIKYAFWTERGVVAFGVYNKLNKPLYIDWKKSSCFINTSRSDYWTDRTTITSASAAITGPLRPYSGTYGGIGLGASQVTHQERISFIAPQSSIVRYGSAIWTGPPDRMDNASPGLLSDQAGNPLTVIEVTFDADNSPIHIRNFLTYSLTEDFAKESYINNEFYVSKIVQMKNGEFVGDWRTDPSSGRRFRSEPFVFSTAFYLSK
jgi:hypothetical protein